MRYWSVEFSALFHRLWSKSVGTPDYDKREWMQLEALVDDLIRSNLSNLNDESEWPRLSGPKK